MKLKITAGLLIVCLFMFQGCETVKGAGQGFKKDVENIKSSKGWIYKTDAWMQEHMW